MTEILKNKNLGQNIDSLYLQKQKLANLSSQMKTEKEEYSRIETECLDEMERLDLIIASGITAKMKINTADVAVVEPEAWDEVYKYIKKNDAWQLLSKKISTRAFKELLEDDEEIAGIQLYPITKISLTLMR